MSEWFLKKIRRAFGGMKKLHQKTSLGQVNKGIFTFGYQTVPHIAKFRSYINTVTDIITGPINGEFNSRLEAKVHHFS